MSAPYAPKPSKKPDYIIGLDLGQAADYSAMAVLQRHWIPSPEHGVPDTAHFLLGHIHRWPLRTSYPQIVSDVVTLVQKPPIIQPALIVDGTGVGLAVIDLVKQAKPAASLTSVLITSGHQTQRGEGGAYHVPKKELVSVLQALLQTSRLKIADIPDRKVLISEFLAFKVKVTTAGNETFEAWRERDHDDLVLAVALACWWAERRKREILVY